jgi:hypothetical protein
MLLTSSFYFVRVTFADHLLLGDFNQQYLFWGRDQAATDTLTKSSVSFHNSYLLSLLLPQEAAEVLPLVRVLESSRARKALNQGSDYLPIFFDISFVLPLCKFESCWPRKEVNKKVVIDKARNMSTVSGNFSVSDTDTSADFSFS